MIEDKYNLRGVEVCGETMFEVVGEKAQTLTWDDYGFQLEVPFGALPSGTTASVAVKAILDGQFALPEGSQMVSVVYWIACSEVFLKEVAVHIQHCAIIRSEEELPNFKFVIAKCSQRQLPYQFKKKGGEFTPQSHYAIIRLKSFSFIGAIWDFTTSLLYCEYRALMGIRRTGLNGNIIFSIHRYLLPVLKMLKQTIEDPVEQVIEFEGDSIELNVPCDQPKLVDGWELQATTYPMFKKDEVDRLVLVPPCHVKVSWKDKSCAPEDLKCTIKLEGAKKPRNIFFVNWPATFNRYKPLPSQTQRSIVPVPQVSDEVLGSKPTLKELHCVKYTDDSGNSVELRLIDRMALAWRRIGVRLNFEYPELQLYIEDKNNSIDCTTLMLKDWLEREPAGTWGNLLQALDEVKFTQTHEKLRAFLSTR